MNKISKKIVSLVTMAAFVLTLVPAAAFAAAPVASECSYEVASTNANELTVTVNIDPSNLDQLNRTKVKVDFPGIDADGVDVSATGAQGTPTMEDATTNGIGPSTGTMTLTFTGVPVGQKDVTVTMDADTTDETGYVELPVATGKTDSAYVSANASVGASMLLTSSDKAELNNKSAVTVDPGTSLDVKFNVLDAEGDSSKLPLITGSDYERVYMWVLNENEQFTDAVEFAPGTVAADGGASTDYVKIIDEKVVSGDTLKMNFNRPGTYTVYAGVGDNSVVNSELKANPNDPSAALANVAKLGGAIKVTINAKTYDVETITLEGNTTSGAGTIAIAPTADGDYTWDIAGDGVAANGTKVYTVTGTALQKDGTPAQYVNLNLDVNKSNGLVLSDDQVSTDIDGTFSFTFTVTKADIYKIDVTEEGNDLTSVELTINKDEVVPSSITTVEDDGIMLAGNDGHAAYVSDVYPTGKVALLSDAVQFEITDTNGNPVVGGAELPSYRILVTNAPDDSTLKEVNTGAAGDDFALVWDEENEVWTLGYTNNGDVAKDLIAGEYSVRVAFDNNTNAAVASFTLAKFGKVQGLVFNGADEVVLGEKVKGSVSYVDEQGIKVPVDADDVRVTASGDALATVNIADNSNSANGFIFATKPHTVDNEAYYGTTITLTAFDESIPDLIQKEVTVVAADTDYSLAFDKDNGPANENNRVQLTVVDSEGDLVKAVNGETYAYVVSSSDETAKVDVSTANVVNGKGALTIYSDKETTLDIAVVVVTTDGKAIYAGNLDYTVGAEETDADETSVVMTMGNTTYVVNNAFVSGDAAPYVDENWRTMVPVRVLGETFGGTVTYENNVITIENGDTTVVMTIGEETYTVNDEEKTMNTAPVIRDNDRAYVPVRFMAEALGYTVTPLQAADGTTASVVFQK